MSTSGGYTPPPEVPYPRLYLTYPPSSDLELFGGLAKMLKGGVEDMSKKKSVQIGKLGHFLYVKH